MPVLFSDDCVPEEIEVVVTPPPVCGGCLPVGEILMWRYRVPTMVQPFACRETTVTTMVHNNGEQALTAQMFWRICGTDVRCAGYARFGTKELSELALAALEGRNACLLANHGMIALGANLDKAMWLAVELETISRQYYLSLALDSRVILSDDEIADTAKGFSTYGLQTEQPKKKARASVKASPRRTEKKRSKKR